MLEPGTPTADLFNRCLGEPFRLEERLLRQVTEGHATDNWLALHDGRPVGFLMTKQGPKGKHLDAIGVLPEYRRRGIGRQLLATQGDLILGGGPAHLFPGLPHERLELLPFFGETEATGDSLDLWLPAEQPVPASQPPFPFLPCPPEREDELGDFVEREFPGRWAQDTRWRRRVEGLAHVIIGLQHDRVVAFCHTWQPHHRLLGPSIFFQDGLRQPGGIGPVGVAAAARGQQAGLHLVLQSMHHLRKQEAQDLTVDWTTLESFYGRAGFIPWRRYRGLTRPAARPQTA